MPRKTFTVLENNPDVMNQLAYQLGLSKDLAFHDIYSLHDPDLLAFVPRPVFALLVTIPMTPTWLQSRQEEDAPQGIYEACGPDEPVIWFKQTIGHACGSIALLHSLLNGRAADFILPGTELERIRREAVPLKMAARAKVLEDSQVLEDAHQAAAALGQSEAPSAENADRLGNHFVSFVKTKDGRLWELEGSRKGPLQRGVLGDDEDALSEKALKLGLERLMHIEREAGGNMRFSCIALAPAP
ncbi:hypothetical protein BDZ97DRAFT_1855082 [Flammula alnicola]|nr:hypothetical protein BDZ97DRAFT_1855082 [Flammula alnicola]